MQEFLCVILGMLHYLTNPLVPRLYEASEQVVLLSLDPVGLTSDWKLTQQRCIDLSLFVPDLFW
jgi:hypothetical protein